MHPDTEQVGLRTSSVVSTARRFVSRIRARPDRRLLARLRAHCERAALVCRRMIWCTAFVLRTSVAEGSGGSRHGPCWQGSRATTSRVAYLRRRSKKAGRSNDRPQRSRRSAFHHRRPGYVVPRRRSYPTSCSARVGVNNDPTLSSRKAVFQRALRDLDHAAVTETVLEGVPPIPRS